VGMNDSLLAARHRGNVDSSSTLKGDGVAWALHSVDAQEDPYPRTARQAADVPAGEQSNHG
jgi:hypothetical protein